LNEAEAKGERQTEPTQGAIAVEIAANRGQAEFPEAEQLAKKQVALAEGVALETNGLPDRLDLSGPEIRLAIEAGVPIVVSTDAHSVRGLGNMQLAVHTARRGWATAADVVNTRPLDDVLARRR